jgi:hypothetical protein
VTPSILSIIDVDTDDGFEREVSMFFEHDVKTGEDSVFGSISQYSDAVAPEKDSIGNKAPDNMIAGEEG